MRLRGEREVTSQADTVIEIDAMNRYIHDGTAARASRASYEVIAASYIRRGGACVWGRGSLRFAIHCIVAGRYDNANYDSR